MAFPTHGDWCDGSLSASIPRSSTNMKHPAVTTNAETKSAALYRLFSMSRPQHITGMILAHLASVLAANERYLSTSYWHTVVTRLPNAIMAYSSRGVPFGENRSPVRKIPVALTATVTSRFMRTRKMDDRKNSGGGESSPLPPPYGMVMSLSCSTPYMHSDTSTPNVHATRFPGVRYRRDVRVATWGIHPSASPRGGFAPRALADLDLPRPAPYMSLQDPMKNPRLCLNQPRPSRCLGDLPSRASSSSWPAPPSLFWARSANSSSRSSRRLS